MKTFLILSLSLIFLNLVDKEILNNGTIEVTVTNVESSEGIIRAVIFNAAEGFPQESSKI